MRTTWRSLFVLMVVLALAAAACGGDAEDTTTTAADDTTTTTEADETTTTEAEETTTTAAETTTTEGEAAGGDAGQVQCGETLIGFTQPLPNPAIDLIRGIVEGYAAEEGHEVTSAVADLDPNKQISDIDSMIQQGIGVLVAYPVDTNAIQPALQRAVDADIPVVVVDTTGDGVWETSVLTANYDAAKLAGDYLAGLLGEGGTVGVIEGPPFAQTLIDRNMGFADAAADGGLEVVGTGTGAPDNPDAARQIADAWKLDFPDLGGILAFSDLNAFGAGSALDETFQPLVVGVNGEPDAIEAIAAGRMAGTADVQPVAVGTAIYYAAEQAFCGEDLPAEISVPAVMVTPDNVGDWLPWEQQLAGGFAIELEVDGDTAVVNTDGLTFGG